MSHTFTVSGRQFLLDGKPFLFHSGAMHYFRVHPGLWRDRLVKARQMGLNCIETYIPWNLHEPEKGAFSFDGWLDFVSYIRMAQEEGLYVIVRPSPYICSEIDLGGIPYWMLNKPGVVLRHSNTEYLECVKPFMHEVLSRLVSLQIENGGPILLMQVENEYGSFGCDPEYFSWLIALYREEGITVPLITSDGELPYMQAAGAQSASLVSVNGRNHPARLTKTTDNFRYDNPPFVMELWAGAALHSGRDCKYHKDQDVANDVAEALEHDINFNLYMFHGGTTFGFLTGANRLPQKESYTPMATSYDGSAPLPEDGMPGKKYYAIQKVLCEAQGKPIEQPALPRRGDYGYVPLTEMAPLLANTQHLGSWHHCAQAEPMEKLGQDYGFILYRYHLAIPGLNAIQLVGVQDRAVVMLDGRIIATVMRDQNEAANIDVFVPKQGATLDVLVENMGRVNYGIGMQEEKKGLAAVVLGCSSMALTNPDIMPLPMKHLEGLEWQPAQNQTDEPAFYRGNFRIDGEPADTFFRIPTGVKGIVWINGFNLGRYWNVGPQMTLYVPAPLLKQGDNEVIVFEEEHMDEPVVRAQNHADFIRRYDMQLD